VIKAKTSPTELGHYAREVFKANELPYMSVLGKDLMASWTNIIDNLYEASTTLGHCRDGMAVSEGRLALPLVEVTENAKTVHKTSYYRGWAAHFQWEMGGLQQEQDRVVVELAQSRAETKTLQENLDLSRVAAQDARVEAEVAHKKTKEMENDLGASRLEITNLRRELEKARKESRDAREKKAHAQKELEETRAKEAAIVQ
jgi:hypothetical protein